MNEIRKAYLEALQNEPTIDDEDVFKKFVESLDFIRRYYFESGVHSQLHEITTREKTINNLKERLNTAYKEVELQQKQILQLKSALQQIADMPDALYKSDAVKMRKIARDAVKS